MATVEEMKQWYEKNRQNIQNYADAKAGFATLRDVTKPSQRTISAIDRENLRNYIQNISGNEKNLRDIARYLYYRSNILYRIVNWYADMWDLRCRKVVPQYDLKKSNNANKILKSYNDTLDILERMNLHGNMTEILLNVYVQDICYALVFYDDTGMFFYVLDPDECMIDGRYFSGDFSFCIDMSKWKSTQRQKIIEYLGEPLQSMYREYERTGVRYIHVPDEYALCLKFRSDTWDTVIPPFLTIFLQLAGLEDLVDIQAEADALSIYKLIYAPMEVHSSSNDVDDFEVTPDLLHNYLQRMINIGAVPDGVALAQVPVKELKTIEFDKSVDSDTNSVEKSSNQVLQTAGGGAVINASRITTNAAFQAWLKAETEFAMSTLLPQINGFTNRFIGYKLKNAAKVEHFEVSVYTKDDFRKSMLESCQYSYSNRLAYNTLLGISEKDTLAMMYLENDVLKLQDLMKYPLSSSFTNSGENGQVGQGAPTKDPDELSNEGDRSRNR